MDCEKMRELLSEYIDGRLSVEESAAVAAHLEGCVECREFERELRATVRLVGELERRGAPEGFADGVAAALERKMLLEEPVGPRVGRRWAPWSFAGLSLAAAAAVLAVVLVGGPRQDTSSLPAKPAVPGVPVAMHTDEIGADLLASEATSELAVELKVPQEREGFSDLGARVGKGVPEAENGAAGASHLFFRRRATNGEADAGHFSWAPLEAPPATVQPQLKIGGRTEVARESGVAGEDSPADAAETAEFSPDEDEKAGVRKLGEGAAEIETPLAGARDEDKLKILGYMGGAGSGAVGEEVGAVAGDIEGVERAAASPVEVAEAPAEPKPKEAETIPRIEFYSEQSALQATVLFANNFLAPESQMAPAESTPEELKKRLTELRFQVIEMSDARTVLQMEMAPVAILSNNELLVRNASLTQAATTPREITSQVSIETRNAITNQAPVAHAAPGKPLAVQYVFIQRPRREAEPPSPPQQPKGPQ